ncbi:MAG TPA: phenylalanine--tRNA ligase subunit beta [Chlamydiales bacterium]|nr:phenylalanine--tRNA ligase subunit beta [Chlamydiales bacterium]
MKVPLSLLKQYLPLNIPIETICETLTLLGIEVDSVINEHPPFAKVIVGEILSVKPHGDKLQIAQVDNGKQAVQVVCGASNCRPGIKTAFAVVGSMVNNATIEKATIRGAESYGMLCSAGELQIWKDHTGILELPSNWHNGTDLSSLLWDPILELSLTPNLGHCLSALGIARELAAKMQEKMQEETIQLSETSLQKKIKIQIDDSQLVPLYMGRVIENVQVGPSPFWLQKILHSCGLRPINNIVDITNYILIKRGQPLHAFDYDRLDRQVLHLGLSKHKEIWRGIDGLDREIPVGTFVISDAEKIVAIAGAHGGDHSAVNENTKTIFLEAAFFDPMAVRKSAKKAGVRTDSSIRFEKGVDPNGVEDALNEAAALIAKYAHGTVGEKFESCKGPFLPKKLSVRPERVNKLLGTKLSRTEMENIFQRLGIKISGKPNEPIFVEIPTYRFDLNEEIDLIEEVVRIYGYNTIDKGSSRSTPSSLPNDAIFLFEKNLRKRLSGLGLQEFLTSNLISPKLADLCSDFMSERGIQLHKTLHAKTEEYSILRPSLFPGLMQVALNNFDVKNNRFSGFEIGHIHFLQNGKSVEVPMLALLLTGQSAPTNWQHKSEEVDFYTLKGLIENLFSALRMPNLTFKAGKHIRLHPGRQAEICFNDLVIGSFGEIHPKVLSSFGIKQRLLFAEMDIEHLMKLHCPQAYFTQIPHLPSSERDLTIPVPLQMQMETLFKAIEKNRPKILEKFELIDLYTPENADHKNATIRFTYRDPIKTVSSEEVEKEHADLIAHLKT